MCFRSPLTLHWQDSEVALHSFLSDTEGTVEEVRRRQVCLSMHIHYHRLTEPTWQMFQDDPVQSTKLTSFVAASLTEVETLCGGPDAFRARYSKLGDNALFEQLLKELSTPPKR